MKQKSMAHLKQGRKQQQQKVSLRRIHDGSTRQRLSKTSVLKMLKELKQTGRKIKKMMYKQNENNNEKI